MGYTKSKLISDIEKATQNMQLFYKQPFINYRGRTTDTNEYYTEIVCEWLLNHLDYLGKIPTISREKGYHTEGHDGSTKAADSNRKEERIAMEMFRQGEIPVVGKIVDYQTPLKNKQGDNAGKIDLLSHDGKTLRILELKIPESSESMLRCVIEGYTYLKTVDTKKLLESFRLPADTVVVANPLVHIDSLQRREMKEDRPRLKELITVLGCTPFYYDQRAFFIITAE